MSSMHIPEIFGSKILLLPLDSFTYSFGVIAVFIKPASVFLLNLTIIQIIKKPVALKV